MSEPVLHSWNGGVLEITLNRPDRLNSFNDDMHVALAECFDTARDDARCRAVLLTGAGRGFCAGQDLSARDPSKMDGPPDLGDTLTRFYNPLIRRIRTLEKPIVCAVNGVAAGAGANLALACDIVLAARKRQVHPVLFQGRAHPRRRRLLDAAAADRRGAGQGDRHDRRTGAGRAAEDWGMIWKACATPS
jgi:2-(1,2-epoxy-1,2-dihydrophenyl)acetyl-CoA isomerase